MIRRQAEKKSTKKWGEGQRQTWKETDGGGEHEKWANIEKYDMKKLKGKRGWGGNGGADEVMGMRRDKSYILQPIA